MPTDPHDGIDDWFVPGTTPAGTDGPDDWYVPTGARVDTSYPDDWYVPAAARADTSYPDDWHVPASAASTGQPAPRAQPTTANPGIRNQVTPRPDPFAAYWSLIPASRAGAMAWHPPIFPNSAGQFSLPAPAPPTTARPDTGYGLLGALANLPEPTPPTYGLLGALANLPAKNITPTYGLLGALANLPSVNPAAFQSFQPAGLGADDGIQSAPPSLPQSSANLAWSPPQAISDATRDTDSHAVGGNGAESSPPPENALFDSPPFDASPSLTPPAPNWQPASPAAAADLQRTGLTSDGSDQSIPRSSLQNLSDLDRAAPASGSSDVEDNSASNPSASSTSSNESRSMTGVVRDPTGRALAIIHVQQEPSASPSSESVNDATPDVLRSGAKYAQINNAVTGYPVIDRTTDMLLAALRQSIVAMGSGSGPLFGIRVHTDFAKRVKQLDLPGIGQDGVEQSFHFNFTNFVQYGMDGSIRTDIALRDPKNPSQGPIAVYDLKTGNAVLTPSRVEEIRNTLKQKDLPVIMLHYRTGDALSSPGRAPPP